MPRKPFKGVFYAKFKDEPRGESIGFEWVSKRGAATFQEGMELLICSYLRHDKKKGRGYVDIGIIGNDGHQIMITVEMRIVSGPFNNAWNRRRMFISAVE